MKTKLRTLAKAGLVGLTALTMGCAPETVLKGDVDGKHYRVCDFVGPEIKSVRETDTNGVLRIYECNSPIRGDKIEFVIPVQMDNYSGRYSDSTQTCYFGPVESVTIIESNRIFQVSLNREEKERITKRIAKTILKLIPQENQKKKDYDRRKKQLKEQL